MRIFLVRHGESESNVDKTVHQHIADHAIPLSKTGELQAQAAAKWLLGYFQKWEIELGKAQQIARIRIWNSPYLRTRQTAKPFLWALHEGGFRIDPREHILLCEQQFGLFDGLSDEELAKEYPREHAHYQKCEKDQGRFWARMPLGESRFDVATRVHQAFGTFHRDFDKHKIGNIVVVCHGVTIRAFVCQWLHLPFEWMDEEPNPANCSIRMLVDGEDRGYIYEGGLPND